MLCRSQCDLTNTNSFVFHNHRNQRPSQVTWFVIQPKLYKTIFSNNSYKTEFNRIRTNPTNKINRISHYRFSQECNQPQTKVNKTIMFFIKSQVYHQICAWRLAINPTTNRKRKLEIQVENTTRHSMQSTWSGAPFWAITWQDHAWFHPEESVGTTWALHEAWWSVFPSVILQYFVFFRESGKCVGWQADSKVAASPLPPLLLSIHPTLSPTPGSHPPPATRGYTKRWKKAPPVRGEARIFTRPANINTMRVSIALIHDGWTNLNRSVQNHRQSTRSIAFGWETIKLEHWHGAE